MTNVRFPDISDYKDIETLNLYRERLEGGYEKEDIMRSIYARSRDNARTPMQWSAGPSAGFTTGTPWIAVNPNYTEINAEEERKDPDSVYHFYQKLIRLRKTHPVFVDGKFDLLLPEDERIFAYTRTEMSGSSPTPGQTGRIRCSSVQTLREERRRARWMQSGKTRKC